jgi:membrane-associated phospholipid phosphatase
MSSRPSRTIEIDKALIVGALVLLVTLGWITGAPIFEPFGQGRLTYMTVLALPVFAALLLFRRASPGFRSLVGSWWPVVAILAVYESLKHMHANRITQWLGIEPKDALMLRIDEALFGKALPLWMDSWTATWFQELMTFCYIWIYYLWPVALLSAAYLAHRDDLFRRLRLGLVFGLLGGYVLYIFVPVAGPLYLIGDRFQHPIPGHSRLETLFFDALRFNWDCFPSLHTAIPWLLTVLIWKWLPRWVVLLSAALASAVTLSTVALRIHYGVDLLAAFVWVGIVAYAVNRASRSDYGRLRVRFGGARRRATAKASPARAALGSAAATLGLVAGATLVALLVQERWSQLWVSRPLLASGVCLAGTAFGVALGLGWLSKWPPRSPSVGPSRTGAIACLGIAGAIVLLASPVPALTVADGSAKSVAWTILLGVLFGVALGEARRFIRGLGLRRDIEIVARWSALGASAAALLFRSELFPRLGYGDSLLVSALLAAASAFLALRRETPFAAREPEAPSGSAGSSALLLLGAAGAITGASIPAWTYLYGAALGDSFLAFGSVLTAVALASWIAGPLARRAVRASRSNAVAGWPAYERAAAGLLVLGAVALSITCFVWDQAPLFLARAASRIQSLVAVDRAREVAVGLLVFLPALLLVSALRALSGSNAAKSSGRSAALVPASFALGSALFVSVLFDQLGTRASLAWLALFGAAVGTATFLRGPIRRMHGVAAALAMPLLGIAFVDWQTLPFAAGTSMDIGRRLFSQASTGPIVEDAVAGFVARFEAPSGADPERWSVVGNGRVLVRNADPAAAPAVELAKSAAGSARRALVLGASPALAQALADAGVADIEVVEPSLAALDLAKPPHGLGGKTAAVGASIPTNARVWLRSAQPADLVISRVHDYWLGLSRGELTREFYALVRARLDGNGAFVQAIDLDALGPRELPSIVAAIAVEFRSVTLWIAGGNLLVLALPEARSGARESPASLGPPLLSPELSALWLAAEGPEVSSDRSGSLELGSRNYRLLGSLAEKTPAALRASIARRMLPPGAELPTPSGAPASPAPLAVPENP